MAGKKPGGSKKKPGPKRTNTRAAKTRSVKSSAGGRSWKNRDNKIDKTPVYVLAIMVLITIIIIMFINNYNQGRKNDVVRRDINKTDKKEEITAIKDIEENKIKKESEKEDISKEGNTKEKIVTDKKETAQSEYYIYLVKFDRKNEKMSVLPVKRKVRSESPLSGVLNELIKGPDKDEKKKGFLTAIPDDLKIRDVQVVGRNAVLDFNEAIETDANGEILLTRIDQLVYTATQFKGIDSIIIKVNGKQKKFIGGEGLSINGPIGRREE